MAAYEAKYGKKPSPHSIVYYDGVQMYAHAIAKAGSSRRDVLATLKATPSWKGVQGTYQPNVTAGDMIASTVIIR